MCLDSQDESTKSLQNIVFKIKNTGGLVIKFLSKYFVSIKSALVKQRQVDESRESEKRRQCRTK